MDFADFLKVEYEIGLKGTFSIYFGLIAPCLLHKIALSWT